MGNLLLRLAIALLSVLFFACNTPTVRNKTAGTKAIVGGGCDGCELMYVGMPEQMAATDTSAGWYEQGQKLLLDGTVFQPDGKTPARDIVIYYWQTDHAGYYSPRPGMDEKARLHGHIRGWVKTGADGRYQIATVRPAPYPNDVLPAHIHFSVKEPGINEYYIDDINFLDDTLLRPYLQKYPPENRGGNGIVSVSARAGVQTATRDVFLGLNIPAYPHKDR